MLLLLLHLQWNDAEFVLSYYKTEACKKQPRFCRQGYACPHYHNAKDRRRNPKKFKYRSTPCPTVKKVGEDWQDPQKVYDQHSIRTTLMTKFSVIKVIIAQCATREPNNSSIRTFIRVQNVMICSRRRIVRGGPFVPLLTLNNKNMTKMDTTDAFDRGPIRMPNLNLQGIYGLCVYMISKTSLQRTQKTAIGSSTK